MAKFSDLPTEMKAAIFACISRNRHRRTVCLVSRNWRETMGPILWKTLYLRAATNLQGDLACLLSSGNGVLANVRHVHIYGDLDGGSVELGQISNFGMAVKLIFGALPRNCLSGVSFDVQISMSTVLNLLQSQQVLQILRPRTILPNENSSIDLSLSTHASWVTPTLRSIRELQIPISVKDSNAYKNSAYLIKNTPSLKTLCIKGIYPVTPLLDHSRGDDAFGGPNTGEAAVSPSPVNNLQLQWLDLGPYPQSFYGHINFSGLRVLVVSQCRNTRAFLNALVTAAPLNTALKALEISVSPKTVPSDADIQAIEALVASAPAINKIWLDVGKGRVIQVSCLAGHGIRKSLQQLALSATSVLGPLPYYTISELGGMLAKAPNVEDLAINFCPVNLGHVEYLAAAFKLPEQDGRDFVLDEATSLLNCVAKHPSLRTLRLLTVPSIDCGIVPNPSVPDRVSLPEKYVYTAQVMMQKFATEVLRYLAKQGSKIRTLVVSPDYTIGIKRAVCDENDHQWPRYFYRCGWTRITSGEEQIVAVPASPIDVEYFDRPTR